jgi:putative nucleotidyltransferase with HDIG domain
MSDEKSQSLIEILDAYINNKKTILPPFSKISLDIQNALSDPNTKIETIEKLITSDQAITSLVLRMANSAFFKGLQEISTIRSAIVRLGNKQLSKIVMLVTQGNNFKSNDPLFNEIVQKLWQHSVASAVGAEWLAEKCGYSEMASEAFTCGLLHDIGKLLILTAFFTIKKTADNTLNLSKRMLYETIDPLHAKHGFLLMKQWNLPEKYCEIARDHHMDEFDSANALLSIVRLTNQTCNKIGIGLKNADPSILLAATLEADSLGLSEIKIAEFEMVLEDSLSLSDM